MHEEAEWIDTQLETRIDKMIWEGCISLGTIICIFLTKEREKIRGV